LLALIFLKAPQKILVLDLTKSSERFERVGQNECEYYSQTNSGSTLDKEELSKLNQHWDFIPPIHEKSYPSPTFQTMMAIQLQNCNSKEPTKSISKLRA
jgi:hypothetical protein